VRGEVADDGHGSRHLYFAQTAGGSGCGGSFDLGFGVVEGAGGGPAKEGVGGKVAEHHLHDGVAESVVGGSIGVDDVVGTGSEGCQGNVVMF